MIGKKENWTTQQWWICFWEIRLANNEKNSIAYKYVQLLYISLNCIQYIHVCQDINIEELERDITMDEHMYEPWIYRNLDNYGFYLDNYGFYIDNYGFYLDKYGS